MRLFKTISSKNISKHIITFIIRPLPLLTKSFLKYLLYPTGLVFLFSFFFSFNHSFAEDKAMNGEDVDLIRDLLTKSLTAKDSPEPKGKIYRVNEILYCDGEGEIVKKNNEAASLLEAGKFKEASIVLENALKKEPLFFPYHYNLGISYTRELDFPRALLHLGKARDMVPDYFIIYVQYGRTYELIGNQTMALVNYKNAIRLKPNYLNALVLAGNIYFKQNQMEMASKYYDRALSVDPYYPNAILGKAKILFSKEKTYQAYMLIKTINLERDKFYDKGYHYYYAECAYKLQKFKESAEQYELLLKYRGDPFFISTSIRLIEHKLNLSKRFSETLEEGKEFR